MRQSIDIQIPVGVEGISEGEQDLLSELAQVWSQKYPRNAKRTRYYEGHNSLKDLGISIPPSLVRTETVVGWPAKAVDQLAAHSIYDGFMAGAATDDPLELRGILNANRFHSLYQQAVRSQLTHSVVFWTVSYGDKSQGEPVVVVSVRSAEYAAAIWDTRRKRIRAGLAITDTTFDPVRGNVAPSELTLYLDDVTVILGASINGWEVIDRVEHHLGRPLMEPMPFKPSEARPFGNSRISREVMSITDSAQRAALRTEVLMEFNTAPQKYLLGANEESFEESKWKAYLDEILAISKDEDGDTPSFGQLPQLTPQGAIQYFSHLASRFAGATGIPVSSLGVVSDNPSSAQAIREGKDDLVTTAQELNADNAGALGNVARLIVAVRDNVAWADLPEDAWQLAGQFRNPANPSIVSQSDAMVKQIAAIPWLADTTVALQELGYDEGQIVRLLAEKRRAEGGTILERLANMAPRERVTVNDLGEVTI